MDLFCHVDSGVVGPPQSLIGAVVDNQEFIRSSQLTANIQWLKSRGWYQYEANAPVISPWQKRTRNDIVLSGDVATGVWSVADCDLTEIKQQKVAEVLQYRQQQLFGGFEAGGGDVFSSDAYDLISGITAMLALDVGAKVEADLATFGFWKTDGAFKSVTTTVGVTGAIGKLFDWIRDLSATAKGHIDAINALGTAQAVYEYDYTTGW